MGSLAQHLIMSGYVHVAQRQIVRRPPVSIPVALQQATHPLLAPIFAARGVERPEELEHELKQLLPFTELSGIEAAVGLLTTALRQQQRILIVGDYDADGATSSALAVRALRQLGAEQVDFLVPNRFRYGYGLTPAIVEVALQRQPQLLITVDNGIASVAGVASAAAAGVPVLITDHHLPPAELPAAAAIVNPNLPGDRFASKALAGVGVIFYLMLALRARLRDDGWFTNRTQPNMAQLLDLVALGTVADVVPLDHNNRILVAQGLARIRAGECCVGISALAAVAQRPLSQMVSSDLGFALGPRLNAAGRMDDMQIGIAALVTDDPVEAHRLAQQLDALNRQRRAVEYSMQEEAQQRLLQLLPSVSDTAELPYGLCLFDAAWHEGVIGILASRVKDQIQRPVIIFTRAEDGDLRGSARSIPQLHIRDVLEAVSSRYPGLIKRFGGHAMAAGLTIAATAFTTFEAAFDTEVRRWLQPADLRAELLSDGVVDGAALDLPLAHQVRSAVPWGQGFTEPLFDGEFEVVTQQLLQQRHLRLTLRWADGVTTSEAIWFGANTDLMTAPALHLAYRIDVNHYRGNQRLQLRVEHATAS